MFVSNDNNFTLNLSRNCGGKIFGSLHTILQLEFSGLVDLIMLNIFMRLGDHFIITKTKTTKFQLIVLTYQQPDV